MIATYQGHTLEATIGEDGLYHVTIDGIESGVTAKAEVPAIKRAMRLIDERNRQEQRRQTIRELKEAGL